MSKTNIKMSQPTYIVKKDDGIIICKIRTQGNDEVFKFLNLNNPVFRLKLKKKFGIEWLDDTLTFTGITRHHKTDLWNEVLGKRISEGKCKRKIYNFYCNLYNFLENEVMINDIDNLRQYSTNLGRCIYRENQHLKDLIGN